VFCALHDQLASLGRHAQLTRCFSAVAELLVFGLAQAYYAVLKTAILLTSPPSASLKLKSYIAVDSAVDIFV